jgi:hypothetical protein
MKGIIAIRYSYTTEQKYRPACFTNSLKTDEWLYMSMRFMCIKFHIFHSRRV